VTHTTRLLCLFILATFYKSSKQICDLKKGSFGILEPDLSVIDAISSRVPKKKDVIFVPSVAVDEQGNRLGRGMGFYDRFLKDVSAWKISVVPQFACVEKVPSEEHDKKMDEVLVVRI